MLAGTANAQCVNCGKVFVVPTLAPALPTQTYSIVEKPLPLSSRMAIRAEGRRASRALYPSVRAISYGSTGTPAALSYGSTGTPQQATYSFGSTGTPTYSLGSAGTPTVASPPVCTCGCPGCVCSATSPVTYSATSSVRYASTAQSTFQYAAAPRQSASYMVALRSATERARLGIKGHLLSIERAAGKAVGVGWSSSNPNPATCYNNRAGDYVSIRGRDGWYATKIVY